MHILHMAPLCTNLSFNSLSSSSNFLTNFLVHSRRINFFSVACESTKKKDLNNPFWSRDENNFPDKYMIQYEEKMEHFKQILKSKEEEDRIESLIVVDSIQRLGVSHHFEEEINTILHHHYLKTGYGIPGFYSLHDAALTFRLLRYRGYHVSADVFNNFRGKDGRFKVELKQDVRGLLELYEASQLGFEGENILDEAEEFSSQLLWEFLANSNSKCSSIVAMRLKHPYHKSITRLAEHKLVKDMESLNGWRKAVTEVAQMDLAIRQVLQQKELLEVSMWWDNLGLSKELKLARNQPLKWYTWSMVINDISLSVHRVELTKSVAFLYLIDDIFDLYGTLEELTLFTEAVCKWDYEAMDMLPDYMKKCYKALLDTTNEIDYNIHGYNNPMNSLKQTWGSVCNAFLVEAKWFASGDLPGAEEYLANGKVSSGVHVILVHLYFLLGLDAIHLDEASTLISCVATILRLWDDLGSAKDEHQDGEDGSYIQCYMKDHQGLPIEEAQKHVEKMIASEWKQLNKECFHRNNSLGSSFVEASLNLARMVSIMYSYDENHRLPVLDQYIEFMLPNQASSEHHRKTEELV